MNSPLRQDAVERRSAERARMLCLVDAICTETNKPIGFIIDLSSSGFCLLAKTSFLTGTRYSIQLRLNVGGEGDQCADVVAECRWSRSSLDPAYNKAGFSFVSIGHAGEDLVQNALRLITDNGPEDQ